MTVHVTPVAGQIDQMLTPAQVAERLQIHPETILRWIRAGRLRAARLGGQWRIDVDDLAAFVAARKTPEA